MDTLTNVDLPYEDMRETAIRALADVNAEIAKLETLREVWEKSAHQVG